ncbi:MAG: ABC transporter substrate-binding protein [Bacillaceae bacterium]|nr:ABC transporter substrate-binding protein [Bacillaceae bacterium]
MEKVFEDHVGRKVRVSFPPQRIISLCPSITETLFDLGLEEHIVGRTQFCIHPKEQVAGVRTVGGTKQIKKDVIDSLKPDLIIAEKEENPKDMVEELAKDYPVYVTDVENVDDALSMILDIGRLTDRENVAGNMVDAISRAFQRLTPVDASNRVRAAYVIWQNPFMAAGNHTFIHSMLAYAGFDNVFETGEGRYPEFTLEELEKANPDLIMLSSEPFPFREEHRQEFSRRFPGKKVILVDGEMFIWYGSRMLKAPAYIQQIIDSL